MAILSSCCLNLFPIPSSNPSQSQSSKTTTQIAWQKDGRGLKKQCVLGMACVIIGLEMGNLVSSDQSFAVAKDLKLDAVSKEINVMKWSDKTMCPPWQMNSLETIVPENLPRPSARRRWEGIGLSRIAPPPAAVKVIVKANTDCFSM